MDMSNYKSVISPTGDRLLGKLKSSLVGGPKIRPPVLGPVSTLADGDPNNHVNSTPLLSTKSNKAAKAKAGGRQVFRSAAEQLGCQYLPNIFAEHLSPMLSNLVSPARVVGSGPSNLAFGLSMTRGYGRGARQCSDFRDSHRFPWPRQTSSWCLPSSRPSIFGPILST